MKANLLIGAFDIGYGEVKAYVSSRSDNHIKHFECAFPRMIARHPGKKWNNLRSATLYGLSDESSKYVIGDVAAAFIEDLLSDKAKEYVKKPTYALCVGKAVHELGLFANGYAKDRQIVFRSLVLGLAPGHLNGNIEQEMKEKLQKGIEFYIDDAPYKIEAEKVLVLPQGAGPYFRWLSDETGKIANKETANLIFGTIDVGYETTDYVMFSKRQFVPSKETPSEQTGMRYILEQLLDHLKDEHGYTGDKIEPLIGVLNGEKVICRGKMIDVSNKLQELLIDHIKTKIIPGTYAKWQHVIGQMYRIFVCGGGAILIKRFVPEFLQEFKDQLHFCDAMENARGFHNFALIRDIAETRQQLAKN